MIEIEHTEIEYGNDGNTVKYKCTMMPATKAHKVLTELVDVLGRPALVAIATGLEGGQDDSVGVNVDSIIEVSTRLLMERLTPDSADRIIKTMLEGVEAEGVGPIHTGKVFDGHFRGRILHMYKVVAWSIRVNYRDFFCAATSSPTVSSFGGRLVGALTALTATMLSGPSSTEKED